MIEGKLRRQRGEDSLSVKWNLTLYLRLIVGDAFAVLERD
jgi:hypothetical protein